MLNHSGSPPMLARPLGPLPGPISGPRFPNKRRRLEGANLNPRQIDQAFISQHPTIPDARLELTKIVAFVKKLGEEFTKDKGRYCERLAALERENIKISKRLDELHGLVGEAQTLLQSMYTLSSPECVMTGKLMNARCTEVSATQDTQPALPSGNPTPNIDESSLLFGGGFEEMFSAFTDKKDITPALS
ncbi:hypothetical protein N7513_003171 [Penicillium frequentans]|nr:hypothetical protein N7513_003171 [Penicillium glabrum]